MSPFSRLALCVVALVSAGAPARAAAQAAAEQPKIKDNSFLLEEAYNQEAGVVQHISAWSRATAGGGWALSFTQEWPLRGMRNQLSYTVPVFNDPGGTAVGDVALNYRYQLVGVNGGRVAVAPRLSLVVPTGDEAKGHGTGGLGVQANVPVSYELTPTLTGHGNAGLTFTPSARDASNITQSTTSYGAAGSLIWLATPTVNVMLESVWSSTEIAVGATTARSTSFVVAPGLRWAFNLASGMQIVPGIAYVIGLEPSGSDAVFLYFSVEHSFKR